MSNVYLGGARVRWFVALFVFIAFFGLVGVFAIGYLTLGDGQAEAALLGGWSAIVAAVVYITHPGQDAKPGNGSGHSGS